MKLPANVLALCVTGLVATGCETAVDFERRSAPAATKGATERIEIVQEQPAYAPPRFAQPPPAVAPITHIKPSAKPIPKPAPVSKARVCGPCGMG